MDSLGYAVEELLDLTSLQDHLSKKQPLWKRVTQLIVLLIVFAGFIGFVTYQVGVALRGMGELSALFADSRVYP